MSRLLRAHTPETDAHAAPIANPKPPKLRALVPKAKYHSYGKLSLVVLGLPFWSLGFFLGPACADHI